MGKIFYYSFISEMENCFENANFIMINIQKTHIQPYIITPTSILLKNFKEVTFKFCSGVKEWDNIHNSGSEGS